MDKRNDYNSIPKQQAKERAKNYMRLKNGYIEPKDVVLGYKTSLDAQMLDKLEPKQETIEEAAAKHFNKEVFVEGVTIQYALQEAFITGAKYQAERMYSEEDMVSFAEFVATYPDKNRNVNGEILHAKSKYDGAERTIDLLKQFKKK